MDTHTNPYSCVGSLATPLQQRAKHSMSLPVVYSKGEKQDGARSAGEHANIKSCMSYASTRGH
jgi:hypothetical protein